MKININIIIDTVVNNNLIARGIKQKALNLKNVLYFLIVTRLMKLIINNDCFCTQYYNSKFCTTLRIKV